MGAESLLYRKQICVLRLFQSNFGGFSWAFANEPDAQLDGGLPVQHRVLDPSADPQPRDGEF